MQLFLELCLIMKFIVKCIFAFASFCFVNTEPCTWFYQNSCYHHVEHRETFWGAEAYCDTLYGGHLLAINSQQENDFISARLLENGWIFDDNQWHIGLIREDSTWRWTSGSNSI